jgi:hypothetical protein
MINLKKKKFIVFSPDLKNDLGHHLEYDRFLYKEITKNDDYQFLVFGNKNFRLNNDLFRKFCYPVFKYNIWNRFEFSKFYFFDLLNKIFFKFGLLKNFYIIKKFLFYKKNLEVIITNYRFYFELIKITKKFKIKKNDIITFHTFTTNNILGILWWYKNFSIYSSIVLNLVFRYPVAILDKTCLKIFFSSLKKIKFNRNIKLFSDSEELIKEYSKYTKSRIYLLPTITIQKNSINKKKFGKKIRKNKRLNIVFLGNPRIEKGFFEVIDSILQFINSSLFIFLKKVIFHVQINNPEDNPKLLRKLHDLKKIKSKSIVLYHTKLSHKEYNSLVIKSNIVLVPYRKESYKSRTSGPFCESLSSGKIVITTKDTWMEKQLIKYGINDNKITCESGNAKSLVKSIVYCLKKYKRIKKVFKKIGKRWIKYHNSRNLINKLLSN